MRCLLAVLANPLAEAYTDARGIVRPIRRSAGYDESIVAARARQRRETGQTAHQQQEARRFERWLTRAELAERSRERIARKKEEQEQSAEERLYRLEREREALAEAIEQSGVADLVDLFNEHGKGRSERGLIPFGVAERLLPRRPEHYRTAIVRHAGRPYLRWELVTDELADERGFRHVQDLRDAVEKVKRAEQKLAKLDAEIRRLERPVRRRRNPAPWLLARVWRWLAR